ncbi:MAG TPA: transposase [Ktedonobacterales bacterium]|nr:transposase [Ktedonobacterales bacterium]
MRLTRAVTQIHLCAANHAKIAMLDALATEYLRLCQQYTTFFCTQAQPDKYAAPCFDSPLSQRWQRVAIQQAAGIAQSWRSNYANAYQDYLDAQAAYAEEHESDEAPPTWREWHTPVLKEKVIQANANVALLQPSQDSSFDYWLRLSTLEKGRPLFLPVQLATYHQHALADHIPNSSVTVARKPDGWWLTLSYDEVVPLTTPPEAPVVGVDLGIASFLTTSTGKQYGTFHGMLAERHKRDRAKRQRKAKLRACLEKKGIAKLPSLRNKKLARHVRQEINRAVNEFYRDHPNSQVAHEQLSVASMRFKARRMNAYLYASNLAHLPKQLAWGAAKRGMRARKVKSAYSSQECHQCHFVSRQNRPTQQTFCCVVCGHTTHADVNAAENLASRLYDQELAACADREAIKALLASRYHAWQEQQEQQISGWP